MRKSLTPAPAIRFGLFSGSRSNNTSPASPTSMAHGRSIANLTRLESQLKERLQFAIFPHMISHSFRLSQQAPGDDEADLMELFAPLFAKLAGKCQVLVPHCVSVTGINDVNLF